MSSVGVESRSRKGIREAVFGSRYFGTFRFPFGQEGVAFYTDKEGRLQHEYLEVKRNPTSLGSVIFPRHEFTVYQPYSVPFPVEARNFWSAIGKAGKELARRHNNPQV